MTGAYYNENDLKAAAWLRELIRGGHIEDGEVDTRSIVDVQGDDLRGFRRCHFFAGIGGWAYALRLAGWPDERECWTGSCPCQPWSVAGRGDGTSDPRHLWPAWFRLIRECRPDTIFGEQTASTDGEYWIDLVSVDLESEGYAFAPFDLPACCVGAPHRRQRFWFVADTDEQGRDMGYATSWGRAEGVVGSAQAEATQGRAWELRTDDAGIMGESAGQRLEGRAERGPGRSGRPRTAERTGDARSRMADANGRNAISGHIQRHDGHGLSAEDVRSSFWSDAVWIPCSDGKARPIEPGSFPLAYGVSARVGRLRGYGNAIVPELAAEVIGSYLDVLEDREIA